MTRLLALLCLLPAAATPAAAAELKPETAAAFLRYVRLTEARIDHDVADPEGFLWIDTLGAARRREIVKDLARGQVVIDALETRDGSSSIDVPGGLVHHWIGTVFVPGAGVNEALALMQDYDRHSTYFAPAIARSATLQRDGDRFRVALRFQVKRIITVTMDTENEARFFRPVPDRAHSRIRSTRVTEIADAGTPREAPKAPGDEHGFMWNLNTYWRFLARDGGVYVQCESLTLTRNVPFGLSWIIGPMIAKMPRDSLTFTMARLREALTGRP